MKLTSSTPPTSSGMISASGRVGGGSEGDSSLGLATRPGVVTMERYVAFLRRTWWLPALSLAAFLAVASAYVAWFPKSYVSKAHLWVAGKMRLREGAIYDDQAQNYGGGQMELLQSEMIQARALDRLAKEAKVSIPINTRGAPIPAKLRVDQGAKGSIFELRATGPTAAFTSAFLNATMDEFLDFKRDTREALAGDTYASVSDQISRQNTELKGAEEKLASYARENNVAALEEQAKVAGAYLAQLLSESSRLHLEYQLVESPTGGGLRALATSERAGVATRLDVAADRDSSGSGGPSPYLAAQQELAKLRITRDQFSKVYLPKHPKMIRLDEEISQAENLVEYLKQQNRERLADAKKALRLQIERAG